MEDIDRFKIFSRTFVLLLLAYVIISSINGFIIYGGYLEWKEVAPFFLEILSPSFMIAFFTALYVLVTYRMFLSMKEQSQIMQKQIEESKKPDILVKLEPFGVGGITLKIQNVGKGNAKDISVEFELIEKGKVKLKEKWVHTLLQPTEHARLFLENINYKSFLEKYDEFKYKRRYESDMGVIKDKYPIIINLKKYLEYMQGDRWLIEQTPEDDIHEISKSVKEISKAFSHSKLKIKKENNQHALEKIRELQQKTKLAPKKKR